MPKQLIHLSLCKNKRKKIILKTFCISATFLGVRRQLLAAAITRADQVTDLGTVFTLLLSTCLISNTYFCSIINELFRVCGDPWGFLGVPSWFPMDSLYLFVYLLTYLDWYRLFDHERHHWNHQHHERFLLHIFSPFLPQNQNRRESEKNIIVFNLFDSIY